VILLNLRMHRAGVDNLVRLHESRIAFQPHAAPGATARRFALHAFTHRAEVFLSRLPRIRQSDACDLIVIIMAATGMCARITFSVSFHSLNCTLLKVKCRAVRTLVAGKTTGYSGD